MQNPNKPNAKVSPWKFEYRLWFAVMAFGLHCIEEFALNFPEYFRLRWNIQFTDVDFHVVNAGYLLVLVGSAMIGWQSPAVTLSSASLLAINALFLHLSSTLIDGVYSPGTITGVFFYLPVAALIYRGAWLDGVLNKRTFLISLLLGSFIQVYPLLFTPFR